MRKDPVRLLNEVENSAGPSYIFYRSTPKAVILSITEYEQLLDSIDDYYASLRAQEYEKETKEDIQWISARQMRHRLGISDRKNVQTSLSSKSRKAAEKASR